MTWSNLAVRNNTAGHRCFDFQGGNTSTKAFPEMFGATVLYFKCPNISIIHWNSPSLWRIEREEENRSAFLCFSKHLITSKHLIERTHFYTKCYKVKCFPESHLIIIKSQRKENPIVCSIDDFCHSPSKTHPSKRKGIFRTRNSMCYINMPAQEHLLYHSVCLTESLHASKTWVDRDGKRSKAESNILRDLWRAYSLLGEHKVVTCIYAHQNAQVEGHKFTEDKVLRGHNRSDLFCLQT